jgi:peptidoglycan/LPS O-acetylase OafA/YrhL
MADRGAAARGYVAELDGLRGIAIVLVMVHRMYPRVGDVPWLVDAGWAGVDLFFVISGFLIAGILIDTRGEPSYFRNFYARRVLRIFPLFYLFIGGMLVAFPIAHHDEFLRQAGSPLWYLLQLGNIPEALLGRDPPYWLAPVWSLAIEEQFYLTFPWLVWRVEPRRLARWLTAIAVLALVVRIMTTALVPELDRLQYLFTLCRLDTIAIGCLLAVFARSERYRAWRPHLTAVLIPVIAAATGMLCVTRLDRTTWFGRTLGYDVLAIGLAALVLLVFVHRSHGATSLLRTWILRYPGKLCFGLYLLHRPADTAVSALVRHAGLDETSLAWLPVKIAVALAFATVSWRFLEQPFLRLKHRFSSKAHPMAPRPVATIAALLVVLVACSGRPSVAAAPIGAMDARPSDGDAGAGPGDAPCGDARWPDGPGDAPRDAASDSGVAVDAPGDAGPIVDAAPPDTDPPPPPPGCVVYPEGQVMSPITPDIAAELLRIASQAPGAEQVFGKVGDSMTATPDFLTCFDAAVDLGSHSALADTLTYFRTGDAGGSTPFGRVSAAATGGWTTADVLAGAPSPLDRELAAITPRYAVVLLGTNDVRFGRSVDDFGADLWTIVDRTRARGVIPILSTMPAMHGDPDSNARIPLFNRVIRAIAQGRSLPLIDLHLALATLPHEGIGSDGIHPTVAPEGACALTDSAVDAGYNVRNLLSLEALDRVRRARTGEVIDPTAPRRAGRGTHGDPFRGELPLSDVTDTRTGEAGFSSYGDCGLAASGREIVYRFDLPAATAIDAFVVDRDPVDVDVAILAGTLGETSCVASGDHSASAAVGPGPVFVVVDGRSPATEGEIAVVVQAR